MQQHPKFSNLYLYSFSIAHISVWLSLGLAKRSCSPQQVCGLAKAAMLPAVKCEWHHFKSFSFFPWDLQDNWGIFFWKWQRNKRVSIQGLLKLSVQNGTLAVPATCHWITQVTNSSLKIKKWGNKLLSQWDHSKHMDTWRGEEYTQSTTAW